MGRQDAAIQAAARNLREGTVRYQAGIDPYLNVIAAETVLLTDRQTQVNFAVQWMVARVQLIKALGGGWDVAQLAKP
jgi:outer membrane protein TolC